MVSHELKGLSLSLSLSPETVLLPSPCVDVRESCDREIRRVLAGFDVRRFRFTFGNQQINFSS